MLRRIVQYSTDQTTDAVTCCSMRSKKKSPSGVLRGLSTRVNSGLRGVQELEGEDGYTAWPDFSCRTGDKTGVAFCSCLLCTLQI